MAVDDAFAFQVGESRSVAVLSNDSDPDGQPLSVTITEAPSNGQAVLNSDGSVFYTPNEGFSGGDSFTYRVDDGFGGTAAAVVTITIEAAVGTPVAVSDSAETAEDIPVTIAVLDNDSDGGSPPLGIISATDGANGLVVVNEDGTVTYTPNQDYSGSDEFRYTVSNAENKTVSVGVLVDVTPVNDAPVFMDATLQEGVENTPVEVGLSALVSDPDHALADLSFEVIRFTAPFASVEVTGTALVATPVADGNGDGSVTLSVMDPEGARTEGVISFHIVSVNSPPVFDATPGQRTFVPVCGARCGQIGQHRRAIRSDSCGGGWIGSANRPRADAA